MRPTLRFPLIVATSLALGTLAFAEYEHSLDLSALPEVGTVPTKDGLAAWDNIHTVLSHPRCLNCHVGADNVPLWGTAETPDRIHGMAINAGESRIGAETLSCNACHQTSTRPNTTHHAAPHTGMDWRLAPVEFQWTDRSSAEICAQMRDPARNGGRDAAGLIDHILHDAELIGFITWSFEPGAGRDPAPGNLQAHLEDMAIWTAAGMPCPEQ
ncbi:hypothetical protein ROJ8625_01040 [Roseivivax jejudonensis]|uniref:Cytochrome c domain-containing protein n=1 Tax=Roseivivax jejudonensis TaxID=1529041 RepID=A0A1X6YMV0_9RHOB|nr:hypothetical protein [Roseivivax jejudonensis]SLN26099.1 hypothetical protein ROJ8625_01040 [Roseivivax jejudonensis]